MSIKSRPPFESWDMHTALPRISVQVLQDGKLHSGERGLETVGVVGPVTETEKGESRGEK